MAMALAHGRHYPGVDHAGHRAALELSTVLRGPPVPNYSGNHGSSAANGIEIPNTIFQELGYSSY